MSRALIWISQQPRIKISVASDSIIQTEGIAKDSYSLNYTIVKTGSTLVINTSCPNIYGCAQDFGQMIDSLKLAIAGNK
jgi:dihydroorotate dehydrogenase